MAILCDHLILREKYSMIIRQVKLYGLEYWAIKEHDSKMSDRYEDVKMDD